MQTKADATELAKRIGNHTPYDGEFALRLPGLYAIKVSQPTTAAAHGLQRPSACIVAAGAKKVMIGDTLYEYRGGQVAVYSVDLPLAWQITEASRSEPYLTLKIDLNPQRIVELAAKVFPHGAPQPKETRALYVGDADAHVIHAATRLVASRNWGRPSRACIASPRPWPGCGRTSTRSSMSTSWRSAST